MVQIQTILTVADNSGAKTAKIIGIPGYSNKKTAGLGDIVSVAIQKATPNTALKQ
ncbi:TPA: 50S ribosomal protein L14, partial [Patescibacteria group bacterium]|nr:50S ribosomal protein L14 [Patescibacteria group bacterium]